MTPAQIIGLVVWGVCLAGIYILVWHLDNKKKKRKLESERQKAKEEQAEESEDHSSDSH